MLVKSKEFVNLYKRLSIFQPSSPWLPKGTHVFKTEIPDPSERFINLCDIGKNMDEAFLGFSMANPKVSCVSRDKIIFREELSSIANRVMLISSGVGLWGDFVGRGMLTCMVLGTFDVPKPRVIYSAIKELNKTADRGILAIIPNSFANKVNWGLAIARAYRKGMVLKSILFGDNAYGECKEDERSCLPGIVACYKLAGAMAEEQHTLPVIVDRLNLMFFSTISCHIGRKKLRVGTDLDGRGGFEMDHATKQEVMKEVFYSLFDPRRKYSVGFDPGTEFVILINTYLADWALAETLGMEMITRLYSNGGLCARVYAGNLVPSVSAGFSVTVLPEGSTEVVRWLDRYTSCAGWLVAGNGHVHKYRLSLLQEVTESQGMWFNERQSEMVNTTILIAITKFRMQKKDLNMNDRKGEYGNIMCNLCNILLKDLKENPLFVQYPYMLFSKISEIFEKYFKSMDGLMFALFSVTLGQYFRDHIRPPKRINEKTWERALKRSVKSVAGYYKVGYKDHTVLDIFGPLYMIMSTSKLDVLTDLHLALEVGDEQCWKVKYAPEAKIIEYPYLTMKSAYIMLDSIATMLRGTEMNANQLSLKDIDTTPTVTATKIKEILTAS